MVGCWCTISVVCVCSFTLRIDLVVKYMNFGFACVGCPSLITLPTICSIAQYFLLYINVIFEGRFSSIFEGQFSSTFVGRDIFHGDEVVKRS